MKLLLVIAPMVTAPWLPLLYKIGPQRAAVALAAACFLSAIAGFALAYSAFIDNGLDSDVAKVVKRINELEAQLNPVK